MKKRILISFVIFLFISTFNITKAQEFSIFAKQRVVIGEIMDKNDRPLSDGVKAMIYQSFKDAFVNSNDYEVFEVNIDDIKRQLSASGKASNLKNICIQIGKKADYIIFTTVKLSSTDLRSNPQLIFTSSLYRIATGTEVMSDVVKADATSQSIVSAILQLVSKLLDEKSSTNTSSQQSSYSSNTNNYSNNQSYGSVSNKINGHEYVDLGLSVKWATCNVGAYTPENPGKYYAWGETTTKSSYTSSNSRIYGVSMGDISGNPNYDVVRATWGGTWRLPTSEEFEELIQCCTWTWTTENGTKGYKVTSRRNGNSIFLPAAGYRYDSSLYDAGSYGGYWTPSPYGSSAAFGLYFDSSGFRVDCFNRYCGHSVRAVSE
ncbi:MAG: hypothetical protein IKB57_07920 [Bacteroidaceae bacterium]|nr:hypothetical protein [Bacteroidaceae bacterium]